MATAPGPTEIPNWQSQIVKVGGTVSGSPKVLPEGASQEAVNLYNLDKQQRALVASALKKAGYKVPTDGTFGPTLLTAYQDAIGKAQALAFTLGQEFDPARDFGTYLTSAAAERAAMGTGAGGDGTSITEQESIITKANAKNIINKVFEDQLGRAATDEELAKYTATFKEKAAKKPTVTTTTRKGKLTSVSTTPGFTTGRAEQYLVDKIAQTDEAKAGQVLDYYQTFMRKLGL